MTHQYSKYPLQKEKPCQSSRSNRTSLRDTYLDSERSHNNRVTANYVALHQLVHCQMFRLPGKKTVDRFLLQMMMFFDSYLFFQKKKHVSTCFLDAVKELLVRFSNGCGTFSRFVPHFFVQFQFESSYFCCPAPPGSFVARSHA